MSKILCFGELLLRMSPGLDGQWLNHAQVPVYLGGAELNVATALAKWQVPVKYCTALPGNYLSADIEKTLRGKMIDTEAIHYSGNRIGIYYLPQGADLKSAGVIYDRAHSSFSELKPGMIDWDKALEDCNWFHFSAISPAINENIVAVCREALEAAVAKGLTISIDLNYRAKLWQYGKKPAEVMPQLVKYCDVLMGNIWAVEQLLGIPCPVRDSDGKTNEQLAEAAAESFEAVKEVYPKLNTLAYTFRLPDRYFGIILKDGVMAVSKIFSPEHIVDKAGSGDCFMAGLICGCEDRRSPEDIVDFAAAAAVGKMREKGDATSQTLADIKKTLE